MERQYTPNIGNDDVHALRQFRLARITLEKLDTVFETVRGRELPGKLNTVIRLDRENTPSSRSAGQQREHSGAATDFRDGVTWTHRSGNRFGVCTEASGISDHRSEIAEGIHLNGRKHERRRSHQRQIGAPRPRQSTHKARRYVRGRDVARS